jgi:RNA polymerase sigma factor for flagellar operon FliA
MPNAGSAAAEFSESFKLGKRDKQENDALIMKYAPLIKYIATRIAARLPMHIEIQDLINSGVLGLMDAIEKFDPDKGVKFETYAEYRIKGSILDSLRALDWVPRSVRKVATLLENTYADLEKKLGRPARDEEVAEAMDVEVDKLHKLMSRVSHVSMVSLERDSRNSTQTSLLDRLINPDDVSGFDKLDTEELRDVLADSVERLPEKEQAVVSMYYYNEMTMKEIGKVLSLTESRVSQIHTKAVMRLRGKLRKFYYC